MTNRPKFTDVVHAALLDDFEAMERAKREHHQREWDRLDRFAIDIIRERISAEARAAAQLYDQIVGRGIGHGHPRARG